MPEKNKNQVAQFWDSKPCGTLGIVPENPALEYFINIKNRRYKLEPFIFDFARFNKWKDKKVLEIGCGIGIDGLEFVMAGADYTGIDISEKSLDLAKKYFELNNKKGNLIIADAEKLSFADNSFDLVYSWGVLHHTPDIKQALKEVYRVLKPKGEICIMVYNRHSLVAIQLYLLYGLLKCRPFINFKELFAKYHESPGTKALTIKEIKGLLSSFKNVKIKKMVTPYDLRIGKNLYLSLLRKFIPSFCGFFTVIFGKK